MESFALDPCMMRKKRGGALIGAVGALVGDSLTAGAPDFANLDDPKALRFCASPKEIEAALFAGARIHQNPNTLSIDQRQCVSNIPNLQSLSPDSKAFGNSRGKIMRRSNVSRWSLSRHVAKLSQCLLLHLTADDMKLLNKTISLPQHSARKLNFPQLDWPSLSLRAHADASFASKPDLSSQPDVGSGRLHRFTRGSAQ